MVQLSRGRPCGDVTNDSTSYARSSDF